MKQTHVGDDFFDNHVYVCFMLPLARAQNDYYALSIGCLMSKEDTTSFQMTLIWETFTYCREM